MSYGIEIDNEKYEEPVETGNPKLCLPAKCSGMI